MDQILAMAGLPALGFVAQIKGLEPDLNDKIAPRTLRSTPAFLIEQTLEVLAWRVDARKIGIMINGKSIFASGLLELVAKLAEFGIKAKQTGKTEIAIGQEILKWNDTATLENSVKTALPAPDLPPASRSEMRSWVAENAPKLGAYTVVSCQLEAGLDRGILEALNQSFAKRFATRLKEVRRYVGLVAQTTLTGGLGALMHDLFGAWTKNFGAQNSKDTKDIIGINVI